MCLQSKSSENNRNELFLLFPVFSTRLENFLSLSSNLKLSSTNTLSLEESKFVVWERFKVVKIQRAYTRVIQKVLSLSMKDTFRIIILLRLQTITS